MRALSEARWGVRELKAVRLRGAQPARRQLNAVVPTLALDDGTRDLEAFPDDCDFGTDGDLIDGHPTAVGCSEPAARFTLCASQALCIGDVPYDCHQAEAAPNEATNCSAGSAHEASRCPSATAEPAADADQQWRLERRESSPRLDAWTSWWNDTARSGWRWQSGIGPAKRIDDFARPRADDDLRRFWFRRLRLLRWSLLP